MQEILINFIRIHLFYGAGCGSHEVVHMSDACVTLCFLARLDAKFSCW